MNVKTFNNLSLSLEYSEHIDKLEGIKDNFCFLMSLVVIVKLFSQHTILSQHAFRDSVIMDCPTHSTSI